MHLNKKKPQTIIASPDPMIADPPRDAQAPRSRSSNSDSRSRRPPQIPIHAKTEIRVASKVSQFYIKNCAEFKLVGK